MKTYRSIVLTTIGTPIKEYYSDHGNYPKNDKQLLKNMIEKSPKRDYELIEMMNYLNLNFKIHEDTLIVYDKGFDNIDNKLKIKFIINDDINLFETFFIKGDIEICYVLLKKRQN